MSKSLSPGEIDQLCDELRNGRKLGAIKLYMDLTGGSLSAASDFIDRLQKDSDLEGHDSLTEGMEADELTESQRDEILDQLHQGEKLAAIQLYRAYSGKNLKESKERIESIIEHLGEELPASLASQKTGGCGAAVLLVVASSVGGGFGMLKLVLG